MRIYVFMLIVALSWGKARASNLTVFDAGEGLMARILTNKSAVLVDTGSLLKIWDNLDKLEKSQDIPLTDLIITHLHPDHASGIFEILARYPQIRVFDNCMPQIDVSDGDLIRWTSELLSTVERRECISQNSKFIFDDVQIQVLWPLGKFENKDHNYYSVVLKVTSPSKSVLIMGDANKKVEEWLMANKIGDITNIEVLVVGHHGSDAASSQKFIDVVNPEFAVIPVNTNNIRGYPNNHTLERLKNSNAKIWITGANGDFIYDLK